MSTATHERTEVEREYDRLDASERTFQKRFEFIEKYGFPVLTREAVERAAAEGPLLDAGAGKGYQTHELRRAGADVLAVDISVPDDAWTDVTEADALDIARETDRTLFLAWPPRDADFGRELLAAYNGDTVVYVGEPRDADPANDGMHEILETEFRLVDTVSLPSWPGIDDDLYVYERV